MSWKRGAAAFLLLSALGLAAVGEPTVEDRVARQGEALDARLAARQVQLDPAELLSLMHNNRIQLRLLDVREEAEFNLFHLLDAQRVSVARIDRSFVESIPAGALVVVVGKGEQRAAEGWKRLAALGVRNAFTLAGGIEGWLDVFREGRRDFPMALGARWPASRPPAEAARGRAYEPKAKVEKPRGVEGGGCG